MLSVVPFRLDLNDGMLSAVIAGVLCGTGSALVLRSCGSTGGAEILYVMMYKVFSLTLGTTSLLVNAAILAVATFVFPTENVLYTAVCVIVSAQATDLVFHGLTQRQAALIICDRWKEIAEDPPAPRVREAAGQCDPVALYHIKGADGLPHVTAEDCTGTPSYRSYPQDTCVVYASARIGYKPRFFSVTLTPPPC